MSQQECDGCGFKTNEYLQISTPVKPSPGHIVKIEIQKRFYCYDCQCLIQYHEIKANKLEMFVPPKKKETNHRNLTEMFQKS